jgi:hypothetical protein
MDDRFSGFPSLFFIEQWGKTKIKNQFVLCHFGFNDFDPGFHQLWFGHAVFPFSGAAHRDLASQKGMGSQALIIH